MAEIPAGEYSHIHRSIDQLRSMNERGLGPLGALTSDIRASLVHEYKPFSDLRQNDRLDIINKTNSFIDRNNGVIINDGGNGNNNGSEAELRHVEHHEQKQQQYSAPSTPPTPLSMSDAQMNESKVCLIFYSYL